MDLGLNGKACIVTGASRGIGAAVSRMLAEEGANVLRVSRGGADLELDLTEPESAERVIEECERRHGGVDVLVNNAGTSHAKPMDELTDDEWRGQGGVAGMGPVRVVRAAGPPMAPRGGGGGGQVRPPLRKRAPPGDGAPPLPQAARPSPPP